MAVNKKIILVSFATLDLKKSILRFTSQANSSNFYNKVNILTPKNFNLEEKNKINVLLSKGKKRGYGYWFWKPLLLYKILKNLNEGDIVHYLDIGFHINLNFKNRFNYYIKKLRDNKNWLLAFQYYPLRKYNSKLAKFPDRYEYQYTKKDLFNYFKVSKNKKITHSPQFHAGNFFIKKNIKSKKFLEDWIKVFEKNFGLIDDTPSKTKNFNGFIENRHDQSVFSILCKKNFINSLSAYEHDWAMKKNLRTWEYTCSPFLAKRDLKYNFFRRFVVRQTKNLKRRMNKFKL